MFNNWTMEQWKISLVRLAYGYFDGAAVVVVAIWCWNRVRGVEYARDDVDNADEDDDGMDIERWWCTGDEVDDERANALVAIVVALRSCHSRVAAANELRHDDEVSPLNVRLVLLPRVVFEDDDDGGIVLVFCDA
jgi:hypothetical protein